MAHLHLQRALPFVRRAVYDVIADVARYPEFMPGFKGVRLDGWEDHGEDHGGGSALRVYQTVGGGGLTTTFLTHARFDPNARIDIVSRDRPFHHLHQTWRFEDIPGGRSRVDLEADYTMADRLAGLVFERIFPGLLRSGLTAVGRRAASLERQGAGGARHCARDADDESRRGQKT